jgi:hypothetical protein
MIRWLLFGHPLSKAIALGVFGLLGNVFAGAYIFDITKIDGHGTQYLDWGASPHAVTFWGIVIVLLFMGMYGWGMARSDAVLLGQADLQQKMLRDLTDTLIESGRSQIQAGKITSFEELLRFSGLGKGQNR